jgi:hypothetical protein
VVEIDRLVRRSVWLKSELLEFARGGRFRDALAQAMFDRFPGGVVTEEAQAIDVLDRFVLEHVMSDGRTVLERFVRARGELPKADRELLLSWRDVVEGCFEVERIDGEVMVTVNLVDELTYRIRTNSGPEVFEQMPVGSIVLGRVVPVLDDWLLSGSQRVVPEHAADVVYRTAADLAMRFPKLALRDPQRLALAWRMQREQREKFVEFFGSDLVVLPAAQVSTRLAEYWRHCGHQAPVPSMGGALGEADTVGIIYDEVDGLSLHADASLVQEVFADPELIAQPGYQRVVRSHLGDDGRSPVLLRRCAGAEPGNASQVFARLLRRPSFDWGRDGEALLRRSMPAYFSRTPYPRLTPVGPRVSERLDRLNRA